MGIGLDLPPWEAPCVREESSVDTGVKVKGKDSDSWFVPLVPLWFRPSHEASRVSTEVQPYFPGVVGGCLFISWPPRHQK